MVAFWESYRVLFSLPGDPRVLAAVFEHLCNLRPCLGRESSFSPPLLLPSAWGPVAIIPQPLSPWGGSSCSLSWEVLWLAPTPSLTLSSPRL